MSKIKSPKTCLRKFRGIRYGMYKDFILVILNPLPPYTIKGDYKVRGVSRRMIISIFHSLINRLHEIPLSSYEILMF